MKKQRISKRVLAMLLVVVMIITMIPVTAFADETTPGNAASEETRTEDGSLPESLAESLGAESEKFYEVRFALPKGLTEEEAAQITLPETQMIASGTLIISLPVPERPEYVFMGWCYDELLEYPADTYDAVESNLTLYPSFAPAQNYEDQFRINYISDTDVGTDFEIGIVSYGLSEEMIREVLTVTNLSTLDGEEEYVLEQTGPDWNALITNEKYRSLAKNAAQKAKAGTLTGTLTDALTELMNQQKEEDAAALEKAVALAIKNEGKVSGSAEETEEAEPEAKLDEAAIAEIVAWYAPGESDESTSVMALDLITRTKKADLNIEEVTPKELLAVATEEELEKLGLIEEEPDEEITNTELREALEEVRKESLEQTVNLTELYEEDLKNLPAMYYTLRPAGGKWSAGDLHQVEILNTDHLRFFRDGEETGQYVVYYNITVHQDDFNNMQLKNGIVFLRASEVEGVELDGGLFKGDAATDGESLTVTENEGSGVLTYTGSEEIGAGTTVAVYDGELLDDGSVDGSVGYFTITEDLGGGEYAYGNSDFKDVIFTPDIIPAKDDGSFDDGEILLAADQLDFSGEVYQEMGLDENTVIETGDFLAFYTGDFSDPDNMALTGYGCVMETEESGDGLLVRYDAVSEETMALSADMFMNIDNVPIPLTEEEMEEISRQISEDIENSGFMEETSDYVTGLIMNEDVEKPSSEYGQALQEFKFQREDGSEISLEEVQKLAAGGKVEVKWPPELSVMLGLSLQHFEGTGLRGEAAAEIEIVIHMSDAADLKINVVALIELEVALGLTASFSLIWKKAWIFPYVYDIEGHVGLHAGVYVGAGITVTIQTAAAETDASLADALVSGEAGATSDYGVLTKKQTDTVGKVKKLSTTIGSLAKMAQSGSDGLHVSSIPDVAKSARTTTNGKQDKVEGETDEMHNSVGGGFEDKYSGFIQDSDAEYVPLINRNLTTFRLPADPLHIIALSLGINFVVKFKLNVMLGVSITYGNAREIAATFTVFHPNSESTTADLETPNFRVDFFIFGMAGIRIGVLFDFRIGLVSTKLASLGLTAEVGVYLEFYGYFYVSYEWEAGSGDQTEMFGSLLVQTGLYLDVNFKAQAGNGVVSKEIDLYDARFPLLSLGDEFVALDFEIEEEDESLTLDITNGVSAQVPNELFDIQFMEIATGNFTTKNKDGISSVNNGGDPFTSMGIKYTQMDEQNFHVEYTPLGKGYDENVTDEDIAKGRFIYDPKTNTITAKPATAEDGELWGAFTFTWYQGKTGESNSKLNYGAGFGLNSRTLTRTVKVHWKGEPVTATADIYLCKNKGDGLSDLIDDMLAETADKEHGLDMLNNRTTKYYEKAGSIELHGLNEVLYYLDISELRQMYPSYSLCGAWENYNQEAIDIYQKLLSQRLKEKGGDPVVGSIYNILRQVLYDGWNGFVWVFETDQEIYFMMEKPTTHVDLFFDFHDTEVDWHIIDSDGRYSTKSLTQTKMPSATNVLKSIPGSISNRMNYDRSDYTWYMVSNNDVTNSNIRYKGKVYDREILTEEEENQYQEPDAEGHLRKVLTFMPALSEFIKNDKLWTKVTEDTVFPSEATCVFAVETPKNFTVTWKYDEGDQKTSHHYYERLEVPEIPERKGYEYTGYWLDGFGDRYFVMEFPIPEYVYDCTEEDQAAALEKAEKDYAAEEAGRTLDYEWIEKERMRLVLEQYSWEEINYYMRGNTGDFEAEDAFFIVFDKAWEDATAAYKEKYIQEHMQAYYDSEELRVEKESAYFDRVSRMPAHDLVLYPEFVGKEYKVTWIYDGKTIETMVKVGEQLLPLCPFEVEEGATPPDWYTDLNDPKTKIPVYYVMEEKELTLYGKLPKESYTITWMDGSEKVGESTQEEGTAVALLELERAGYVGCWTLDGKEVADGFTMPARNITLYAKWTEHSYQYQWVLYDTGNRKYVEYSSVSSPVRDNTAMDIMPEDLKKLMNDTRYTYQIYRYDSTDLDVVKKNIKAWDMPGANGILSYNDATYILQRSPVYAQVTWKYDDGDVVTKNWVGRKLTAPKEATREGYDFSHWADADGKKYTYPPAEGVTLYPVFTEHPYQTNWVLYDTGNGKYNELSSEQTTLLGQKVLENIPDEVSKYSVSKNYTYTYYRIHETDLAEVKANKSGWDRVYGSTVFDAYDSTYILQRSPIYTKVTWKYDDGDVVTNNWIGRKLTAPKEITRVGYNFSYWADADGKRYNYPPAEGVTLYPYFTEHDHSWDEGTVTTPATCTATGIRTYTCTECGKTKTEVIPVDPDNHTGGTEIRNAKEATCTEEGYTGDTYCKGCGALLEKGEAIAKTAHTPGDPVKENVISATCTEDGSYDEVVYCEVCGKELSRTAKIEEKGHLWEVVETTDPRPVYNDEVDDGEEDDDEGDDEALLMGDDTKTEGPTEEEEEEEEDRWVVDWEPGTIHKVCKRCGAEKIEIIKMTPYIQAAGAQEGESITEFTFDNAYVLRYFTTAADLLDEINTYGTIFGYYSSTGRLESEDGAGVDGRFLFEDSADGEKILADYLEEGSLNVKLTFIPEKTEKYETVEGFSLTIKIYPKPKLDTFMRRGEILNGYDERAMSGSDTLPSFVDPRWLEYTAGKYDWTYMKEIDTELLGMEWYAAETFTYTAEDYNGAITGSSVWSGVTASFGGRSTSTELLGVTGDTPIADVAAVLEDDSKMIVCGFDFTPDDTENYKESTRYIMFNQRWPNAEYFKSLKHTLTWKVGDRAVTVEEKYNDSRIVPPEVDGVCYWTLNGNKLTGEERMPAADTVITGVEHEWGEPVWHWDEAEISEGEINEVSVTFTCTRDPSHTQTLSANVQSQIQEETTETTENEIGGDDQEEGEEQEGGQGETRTFTATVVFNGKEYTDTATITIAEPLLNENESGDDETLLGAGEFAEAEAAEDEAAVPAEDGAEAPESANNGAAAEAEATAQAEPEAEPAAPAAVPAETNNETAAEAEVTAPAEPAAEPAVPAAANNETAAEAEVTAPAETEEEPAEVPAALPESNQEPAIVPEETAELKEEPAKEPEAPAAQEAGAEEAAETVPEAGAETAEAPDA